ncbi:jumonji, AT rich interactive domain 2 [Lycorma delicatula]|uniref:jumonji, AT rich interactive domain 2 n=1 Tax=Lycorma delicatula TaxID=130591 RepID=UPI003F50E134
MMVLSRTDSKRRRKDDNDVLQESPKRTKVHAQRKFAQGSSNLTSPALTPVKDKVKVNGITPPSDVLPVKRPNTEDFLTFLCFRGTKILPARLDFFSNAAAPESQVGEDIGGSSSSNNAGPPKSNVRVQEKNNSDKASTNVANVKPRTQPTSAQGRAVKALKKKYHEQRLAKQKKTSLTKLVQKVKGRHMVHQTRYGTRAALQQGVGKKQSRPSQQQTLLSYSKSKKVMATKAVKPNISRVAKHKNLRLGLRSGGQLPPGSDIGLKSPVRRPRTHLASVESTASPVKGVNNNSSTNNNNSNTNSTSNSNKNNKADKADKVGTKPIASSLSDFSSDDDQPLVKKSKKTTPLKAKSEAKSVVTRSKQLPASSSASSSGRPSRKTKEAAAVYMEMLGKDLRSPDEYDDDTLSVESFPELPNTKKIELREKELKALAEKNSQSKEDKVIKEDKIIKKDKTKNPVLKRALVNVTSKLALVQKIDERSKRMLLRNKTKNRMLKEKEKVKKFVSRSLRKSAAIVNKGKIISEKEKSDLKKKIENPDKKSEFSDKSINLPGRRRGFIKKKQLVESKKTSSVSSSPQRLKIASTHSERVLRTKQIHTEENYSESDEEPLRVLSAKLPKMKKKKNVKVEENPSVTKKDRNKEEQSMSVARASSLSPERKNVVKRDKSKPVVGKNDVREGKKHLNSEKEKEEKDEKESEISEGERRADVSKTEKEKLSEENKLGKESKGKIVQKKSNIEKEVISKPELKVETAIEEKLPTKNFGKDVKLKNLKKTAAHKMNEEVSVPDGVKEKVPETKCEIKSESLKEVNKAGSSINKTEVKEIMQDKFPEENKNSIKKISKSHAELKVDVKSNPLDNTLDVSVKKTEIIKGDIPPVSSTTDTAPKISAACSKSQHLSKSDKKSSEVNMKCKSIESSKLTEGISKISLDSDDDNKSKPETTKTKSKSDTTKILQTYDNVTDNDKLKKSEENKTFPSVNYFKLKFEVSKPLPTNSNKLVKSGVKSLSADFDKPLKIETSVVLPGSSGNNEDKITPENVLPSNSKIISSDNNKVEKPDDSKDTATSSTISKSVTKSEELKISESATNKDLMKYEDSKMLPSSSNNTVIKCENTKGFSFTCSSKLTKNENLESVSSDKLQKCISTENFQSCNRKVIEKKDILDVADKNEQENKDSQVSSKLTEVQIEKSGKIKFSDGSVMKQKKLEKNNLNRNLSESRNILKGSETVVEEELNSFEKLSEEIKKAPISFTGLLKSQPLKSSDLIKNDLKFRASSPNQSITREPIITNRLHSSSIWKEDKIKKIKPKTSESTVNPTEVNVNPTSVVCDKSVKDSNLIINKDNIPILKTPSKEKSESITSGSFKLDKNLVTKLSVETDNASVKKSKHSVSDTWRMAFKNAKIPKPGQCSPVMTDDKPFVRKPFSSSALKKQIDFDSGESKCEKSPQKIITQTTSSGNVSIINPYSVSQKTTTFTGSIKANESSESITNTHGGKSNVIDAEALRLKEAEVEDFVRRYVGGELEKMHADMKNASCSKDVKPVENINLFHGTVTTTAMIIDQRKPTPLSSKISETPLSSLVDHSNTIVTGIDKIKPILTFTTKITDNVSPLSEEKSLVEKNIISDSVTPQSIIPVRSNPCTSSLSVETGVNVTGGKHHHLPLPVEQTLKKLSQTKVGVSRKTIPSLSNMKQDVIPNLSTASTSATSSQNKEKDLVSTQSCFGSDVDELSINKKGHLNLLSKKKVNMSKEDINKWLNDSTSGGIEHTKNCGIFEKNRCECKPSSFVEAVNDPVEQDNLKKFTVPEETTDKNVSQNLSRIENVVKKESNTVAADKIIGKPKDCNFSVNLKTQSDKKVNVASPLPNRTVDVSVTKLDSISANKLAAVSSIDQNKSSDDKCISNKTVLPSDNLTSNINKLKVSRGTNKMGDSEAENSSRDPSEVSSPPPRDDLSSADESPEKFVHPERRSIFHQRRSAFRSKLPLSRSPSAFSPENESSVYAFEPDLPPTSTPFRRNKSKEGRIMNTQEEDGGPSSTSIAVQVNLDNEAVLECSTQTETDYDESEGHLFYIPLQQNAGETAGGNQQVFQGVAVKLGTEGPDQRVIMRAKLVTKPPSTFSSSSSRPLVSTRDIKGNAPRPEQKVKPLSVSTNAPRPPVGTVQPTTRVPNPPEVLSSPSPCPVPIKRIPTPERIKKVTQSPETPKKEISALAVDKLKKDQPVILDKPNKEVSVLSTPCDKSKNDIPVTADKTRTFLPPPAITKPIKTATSDTVTKESCSVPSTSSKPKRSKSKGALVSDTKGGGGHEGNIKLKDAPSFHPTEREFQDPLEYIEKIRPMAEKFGLCRIIPPPNFKPECKVSDDMRFTAYNQYVHKMLHRWGPNVKEMLAIKRYLATQSIALTHPPWIGGMEVDLPKLYQTVQNCGGLKEVIEKKRWQRVADAMRIPRSAQDRVTKLDDIYCKFLLPYDTLSHAERTKLFDEVEKEWEKRMSSSDSSVTDSTDSNDNSELDECIVKGRNMALNGFYRIARNTMAMYFRNADQPSAHEVEAEFWNHVGTRQSHVCVHSGSIDSGANGYGFPTAKNSSTTRHPWNLKVLTNNSGSILRSLGPIMGVTVPTLHVGMVFTACCWYRDPHGLPWIEYLHTGASKIWYSIPDESSNAFREVVMELVPNLCRDKTIWLASDTAMIPPNLLVKRGISICRTVQEPGQFILVFPKAFTSSICTGYLVSESVYFAHPSWLSTAQQIFKDISDSSEPSMFSLERLLFSIANDTRSHVDVLLQVVPMVQSIKENEIVHRSELEKLGLTISERLPLNKRRKSRIAHDDDSDYECEICRANLFLSLVTNSHEEAVYCLTHAINLLSSKPAHLKYCRLLYTYDMDELDEMIEKIKTRIEAKSQKKSQNKSHVAISATCSSTSVSASSSSQTPGSSTKS